MKAVGEYVCLEPTGIAEHDPKSGLVLPDSAKQVNQVLRRGKVISAGRGEYVPKLKRFVDMPVAPGDDVLYSPAYETEYRKDGKTLVVISYRNIVGIVQ